MLYTSVTTKKICISENLNIDINVQRKIEYVNSTNFCLLYTSVKTRKIFISENIDIDKNVQREIKYVYSTNVSLFSLYWDGEEHLISNNYAQKCTSVGTYLLHLNVFIYLWALLDFLKDL